MATILGLPVCGHGSGLSASSWARTYPSSPNIGRLCSRYAFSIIVNAQYLLACRRQRLQEQYARKPSEKDAVPHDAAADAGEGTGGFMTEAKPKVGVNCAITSITFADSVMHLFPSLKQTFYLTAAA